MKELEINSTYPVMVINYLVLAGQFFRVPLLLFVPRER